MPDTASTIQWQIHALAQRCMKHAEKQIISKFIHKWLPLQDQYYTRSTTVNNQCPSCWCCTEMGDHCMQCPHLDWQAIWHKMHDSLYKIHTQQQVPTQCYNVLSYGLYTGHHAPIPTPLLVEAQEVEMQPIAMEQSRIGWHQLYYGRFTQAWVTTLNSLKSTINGIYF